MNGSSEASPGPQQVQSPSSQGQKKHQWGGNKAESRLVYKAARKTLAIVWLTNVAISYCLVPSNSKPKSPQRRHHGQDVAFKLRQARAELDLVPGMTMLIINGNQH